MPPDNSTSFVLSDAELGVLCVVNLLFSVAGSFGNIFVCVAFVSYRNLRNTINVFIFSLACSDLIVSLIAQPMFVVSLINGYQQDSVENTFENIRKRLTWISMLASAGNLLGVTVDRYIALSQPLRYPGQVTTIRASVFVAAVSTTAIALGGSTESYPVTKMVGQVYVLLLIAIIFPLYCLILCIARKHARVMQAMTSNVQVGLTVQIEEQHESQTGVRKADRNSLKTVGIISLIFFIGWCPILVLPFLYRAKIFGLDVLLMAFQWVNTLALCSSACNPFVYSWRDRRFRRALRMIYLRWERQRVAPIESRGTSTAMKPRSSVTNETESHVAICE